MSIRISIPIVEAAYELLKATPPFHRWKLPPVDQIAFHLTGSPTIRGTCSLSRNKDMFLLEVSQVCHHTVEELMKTLAHEMCHLREFMIGVRPDVEHGREFRKLADQVCKAHQFDRGMF
jgi:predicted SprT family Zn-dependent metalloprotease